MPTDLKILGGGGHGCVVASAAIQAGFVGVKVYDRNEELDGQTIAGIPHRDYQR